jgi:predicted HicB family RNase H-like nuclease
MNRVLTCSEQISSKLACHINNSINNDIIDYHSKMKQCSHGKRWETNMSLKNDRYAYRIIWSEEDGEYVGLCAEFPSLSWLAGSPEDALGGIRKVVAQAVSDMKKSGEVPPSPLSGRAFSGKFIVRVPPEVHRELALKAAEERVSLNRLVSAKLSQA